MSVGEVIEALKASGVVVQVGPARSFSLESTAERLEVSTRWVRDHLAEFPNRWRLPGAGDCGEWRIPAGDIEALQERRRVKA